MSSQTKLSRRQFLALLGGSGAASFGYMRLWEPSWLQIGQHEVPVHPDLPPIKILHLSDFHASPQVSLDQIADAVQLGLALQPDVICLTGDFITWKYDQFSEFAHILKRLSDAAPTFACLGNHDGGSWSAAKGYADTKEVSEMLQSARVRLLHNASAPLHVAKRTLTLVGVGDLWANELDAPKAFANVPPDDTNTVVLLSHNPDSKTEVAGHPWHLMLCGHTHGGQLVIPFFGRPFLPIRDKRFAEGLHRWENRWIHITRGVGNLHGMRLNCPPEVSLLTVT